MKKKIGTIILHKNLIEEITGDVKYYYDSCEIVLMKGEFNHMVDNVNITWLPEIKEQINKNFLETGNITLVRESNYNSPGVYDIYREI